MGVYAQTDFQIFCKNEKAAKSVLKVLQGAKKDVYGDTLGTDLTQNGKIISGFENSGRYQNLVYKCERIWEIIKDIPGVIEMNCPFLMEADGEYFSNDKSI